ncbi:MAG: hypothetical protein H6574_03230 [Lewinellaceae bacterium]|nr:hypothetical protein [Saprospiraceae bacterium]MCB9330070.1 hypothetical protein [Lewinellaceae bacterium]
MAETTKIKVKNVQAGDPHLSFTLEPEDVGSTLPARIRANATVTGANDASYSGSDTQSGGSTSDVNFNIQFADSNYANETTLGYTITLEVPDPRTPGAWKSYGGTVDDGSGTVTADHTPGSRPDVVMADAEPVNAESGQTGGGTQQSTTTNEEPAGSNQGAKNKGCLAFLTMLPF